MGEPNFDLEGSGNWVRILLAVFLTAGVVFAGSYYYFDTREDSDQEVMEPEDESEDEEDEGEVDEELEEDDVDEEADEEEEYLRELPAEEKIEAYYEKLEEGDLEGAYAMKYAPEPSFATFKNWYENVVSANVVGIEEQDDGSFSFTVYLKDEAGTEGQYRTVMRIRDDLLETISAYQVMEEQLVLEAKSINDKATVKDDGKGKQIIYLNGAVIETLEYDFYGENKVGDIGSIYFTPDGNYLVWRVEGWESMTVTVWHVDSGRSIDLGSPSDFGFTKDGQELFACQESGFNGGYMDVYNLPSMTLRARLNEYNSLMSECIGYDATSNLYRYSATKAGDWENVQNHLYFFDSGELR